MCDLHHDSFICGLSRLFIPLQLNISCHCLFLNFLGIILELLDLQLRGCKTSSTKFSSGRKSCFLFAFCCSPTVIEMVCSSPIKIFSWQRTVFLPNTRIWYKMSIGEATWKKRYPEEWECTETSLWKKSYNKVSFKLQTEVHTYLPLGMAPSVSLSLIKMLCSMEESECGMLTWTTVLDNDDQADQHGDVTNREKIVRTLRLRMRTISTRSGRKVSM